jgi:hypothetical protein
MQNKTFWQFARKVWLLAAMVGVCVIGAAQNAHAQQNTPAAACAPGQDCPCTWSPWVNRDAPSGTGDWEDLTSLVKQGKLKCKRPLAVECRYRPNGALWGHQVAAYNLLTPPVGYTCISSGPSAGGICQNNKTKPLNSCKDSEVRFCCLPD